MSTFSQLFFAVRDAIDAIHDNSPVQIIRLCFSAATTAPMFFSDHPQIRLVSALLLSILLLAFALNCSLYNRELPVELLDTTSSHSTQALSKFLIPTTSIWPKAYLETACSAEQTLSGKRLHIKLEAILRDFRRGIIELRDAPSDLPSLFNGQLLLDGWHFKLDVSFKDKARIWAWVISDEFSLVPDEGFPRPCTFADEDKIPAAERIVLKHYCSLFFETNGNVIIWPSLDAIPRTFVRQFIRTTQETLKTKYTTKKTSILSFTASEVGLSVFGDAFVCAALPFSRVFSKSHPKDPQRCNSDSSKPNLRPPSRSSTPLFTRLPEILSLLTSGPHVLRVLSLSNASASYANALDARADALEYDAVARSECIKSVGIQGWREERLYARWEAAVLRAGLMTRWVVLLESFNQ